tara:strand:+ start:803 stop:1765 length:963 start_codon:yes stop_codon:yes gene_type:complete
MTILITGAAGFIGYNFCEKLARKNTKTKIICIDNINNYYSIKIKLERLKKIKKLKNIKFLKIDLSNLSQMKNIFNKYKFKEVYNFAAQAGVRYSENNPKAYINSNIEGFINLISLSRKKKVKRFFYASSSSVYGDNNNFPLKETEVLNPKNFYGLTKKMNENIANMYFENYNFKSVGLRFFTVFGEWGRPDMFMIKYLNAVYNSKKFYLNNHGKHIRDFTYINDVTDIIIKLREKRIKKNEIYNICSNNPMGLLKIIKYFEKISPSIKITKRGFQKADVYKTHGNNKKINKLIKNQKYKNIYLALKNTHDWFYENKKFYS